MASAVVYKWVDAQGKMQYGDRPPDGVHAEVVELLGTHVAHTAAPAPAPSRLRRRHRAGDKAAQDTKKAVDARRRRNRARSNAPTRRIAIRSSSKAGRFYKTGPDGERQYLTSDEIDAERLNAKRDVDATCNSST